MENHFGPGLGCSSAPLCLERVYVSLRRALKVECRRRVSLRVQPFLGPRPDPPENSGISVEMTGLGLST